MLGFEHVSGNRGKFGSVCARGQWSESECDLSVGEDNGVDCEGLLRGVNVGGGRRGDWNLRVHVHLSEGVQNAPSCPFFFLFSDFNQEQMSERANELETSETTV